MRYQLEQALDIHFGEENRPKTPKEARIRWDNLGVEGQSELPPLVYLALQILMCADMGNSDNPKKRDRKRGQDLRKNRTGSRRG